MSNYVAPELKHVMPIGSELGRSYAKLGKQNFPEVSVILNNIFPVSTLSIRAKNFAPIYTGITDQSIADSSIRMEITSVTVQAIQMLV